MKILLDSAKTKDAIEKMAGMIVKDWNGGVSSKTAQQAAPLLVLIGIRSRGVPLAQRIARLIKKKIHKEIPVGILDITLYRDDLSRLDYHPVVKATEISFSIDDTLVYLIDDVLFTGRTIRCALDALFDFGRPERIKLAVLVDRGGRELPVQADVVGITHKAKAEDNVRVSLKEVDGKDSVELVRGKKGI